MGSAKNPWEVATAPSLNGGSVNTAIPVRRFAAGGPPGFQGYACQNCGVGRLISLAVRLFEIRPGGRGKAPDLRSVNVQLDEINIAAGCHKSEEQNNPSDRRRPATNLSNHRHNAPVGRGERRPVTLTIFPTTVKRADPGDGSPEGVRLGASVIGPMYRGTGCIRRLLGWSPPLSPPPGESPRECAASRAIPCSRARSSRKRRQRSIPTPSRSAAPGGRLDTAAGAGARQLRRP
jgi:hypothetical protein